MLSLESIRKKAESKFHAFLLYKLDTEIFHHETEELFFPWEIPAGREFQSAASALSSLVKKTLSELHLHSKQSRGKSYVLVFESIETRKFGNQTCLKKIVFKAEEDYVSFIHQSKTVTYFLQCARIVYHHFPDSQLWLRASIKNLLQERKDEDDYWENICHCVHWLLKHPASNLYIREIPLPVHTKFIESYKPDIISLVRFYRGTKTDEHKNFEDELGLKRDEAFIRFRLGDDDQGLPILAFRNFSAGSIKEVFIIENKMVYLTFPKDENRLCIFGSGLQVISLSVCKWLSLLPIFYFGDLDEHGFSILSRFRNYFYHVQSFCMNTKTLNDFYQYCATGNSVAESFLPNLTEDEQEVFSFLKNDPKHNRLEQERIPLSYVVNCLNELRPGK